MSFYVFVQVLFVIFILASKKRTGTVATHMAHCRHDDNLRRVRTVSLAYPLSPHIVKGKEKEKGDCWLPYSSPIF